jgi:hypothetical protein
MILMSLFEYEGNAIRAMLQDRFYALLLVSLSIAFTAIYLVLLPSLPNGAISLTFVRFITPIQIAFSIIFGLLLGLIITLNLSIRGIRNRAKSKNATAGASAGAILSTFVNVLCCTPVVPSVVALFGASTPLVFGYSVPVEAFFENNYVYFYFISAILFVVSIHYISKSAYCCTVKRDGKRGK